MITRQASCSCGQLLVTCEGEPRRVSLCHCLECQRRTGSAFGIAAFFTREALAITGDANSFKRDSRERPRRYIPFLPHMRIHTRHRLRLHDADDAALDRLRRCLR